MYDMESVDSSFFSFLCVYMCLINSPSGQKLYISVHLLLFCFLITVELDLCLCPD